MFSIFSAYHITILGYFEFLNMLAWRSYAIINIPSMLKFNSPQEPHCKGHSGDVETNCSHKSVKDTGTYLGNNFYILISVLN